jgi:hypothetical protein
MTSHPRMFLLVAAHAALTFSSLSSLATAAPVEFTMDLPGGFNVSINGAAAAGSGPLYIRGVVNDLTADIDGRPNYGEFPLLHVTFTGAGFFNQSVITPLSLVVFDGDNFAFQRVGENNEGVIGWNGLTSAGNFMSNVNDLSTLGALPYSATGTSSFWHDGLGANLWTLTGGHTIGAAIPGGGPGGTFSIVRIPEPSTMVMLLGMIGVGARAGRRLTGR